MNRYKELIKAMALAVVITAGAGACKTSGDKTPEHDSGTHSHESRVDQTPTGSVGRVSEDDAWTFATVPLPQKGNPPRFVSNPDGVISRETEDELNKLLLYAKVDLGIESCVVVVNHVDNSDVESFAYALFDNFEDNNNMMVIVMSYEDRGVRMELGRELESKLSEIQCQQALDNILIPYLREDKPDEGLIALVEGLYDRMSKNKTK
jgi:uncharacterized membrane protein YgcG